jgi:hypothetical protein
VLRRCPSKNIVTFDQFTIEIMTQVFDNEEDSTTEWLYKYNFYIFIINMLQRNSFSNPQGCCWERTAERVEPGPFPARRCPTQRPSRLTRVGYNLLKVQGGMSDAISNSMTNRQPAVTLIDSLPQTGTLHSFLTGLFASLVSKVSIPTGYEDENGFHFGPEPIRQEQSSHRE